MGTNSSVSGLKGRNLAPERQRFSSPMMGAAPGSRNGQDDFKTSPEDFEERCRRDNPRAHYFADDVPLAIVSEITAIVGAKRTHTHTHTHTHTDIFRGLSSLRKITYFSICFSWGLEKRESLEKRFLPYLPHPPHPSLQISILNSGTSRGLII